MSKIREWSSVAADNDSLPPDGWPEFMDKSGVNDSARENMAALRVAFETFPWINLVNAADTVSKVTDDSIQIFGADYTAFFGQGVRVRTHDGATFVERAVESVTFGPNTLITLVPDTPIVQAGTNQVEFNVVGDTLSGAAYHDTGTGDDDVPTVDDLRFIVSGFNPTNMLVNTEFRRWREGLSMTSVADLTYVCDQWKLLVESGNIDAARSDVDPPGAFRSILITHQSTNAQAGIYQFGERANTVAAQNGVCSLSFRVKGGAQAPDVIRFAIVEWTGTDNDVTAEPILTWPASEGTDPGLDTNFNIIGSAQVTLDGTWQLVGLLNQAVADGMRNLGVMIWVDDQDVAVGDSWHVSQVKLEVGDFFSGYIHPREVDHLLELDHYWRKTFSEQAVPGHNVEESTSLRWQSNSGGAGYTRWFFSPAMLKVPTITYYNPVTPSPAGSDFIRNFTDNHDDPVDTERVTAEKLDFRPATATHDDKIFGVHAVADARFF